MSELSHNQLTLGLQRISALIESTTAFLMTPAGEIVAWCGQGPISEVMALGAAVAQHIRTKHRTPSTPGPVWWHILDTAVLVLCRKQGFPEDIHDRIGALLEDLNNLLTHPPIADGPIQPRPLGVHPTFDVAETAPDAQHPAALRDATDTVLSRLPAQERRIIELRFGLVDGRSRTPAELSDELGLPIEEINKLEAAGRRKMQGDSSA